MSDYDRLRLAELASISEFAHTLSDDQWNQNTLCTGWRVRDVISHMTLGYTTPMLPMIGMLAKYRFNVAKASAEGSAAFGSEHTPQQILAVFDTIHKDNVRKGIARVIPSKEGLLDHAGLRLVATDVEWSHGDGPEVRGPGEAILLALTGRPAVLDELVGEGVATLRERVAA